MRPQDVIEYLRTRERCIGGFNIPKERAREIAQKPLSNRSLNKSVVLLQAMLNWGVSAGLIESNPILKRIKPLPKAPVKKRRALTENEIKRVLRVCQRHYAATRARTPTSEMLLPCS